MSRFPAARLAVVLLAASPLLAGEPRCLPGMHGAIEVPFAMPRDGQATVALYTPEGRLVRVLGQCLELERGDYVARWDGMDLWGRLVPAGSELVVKAFTHPGLRATYEFTVGHAGAPPWLTRPQGEGLAMRTGGWMGDHTPPISALAFGDRLFFGCEVAEHGHALIATDLEGRKLWGRGGLAGWKGPSILATDGESLFGVANRSRQLFRIDPQSYKARRIADAGKDTIQAMAAHQGRVVLVLQNHRARLNPFRTTLASDDIAFGRCRPLIAEAWKAVDYQISPRERFARVFYRGGHFQTGFRSVPADGMACFLVVFKQPVPVGTVVLDRMAGVAAAEVYVLAPGVAFEPRKHEPGEGFEVTSIEREPDWKLLGRTRFPRPLAFLPAPRADLTSRGLLVRLLPPRGQAGDFRPDVGMCRVLPRRVQHQAAEARVLLPEEGLAEVEDRGEGPARSWHFRTRKPISEVSPAAVVLDFGKPIAFDGLCFLGLTNPVFAVDLLAGPADRPLAEATEADWQEATTFTASRSRRTGWDTSRPRHNETYVPFFRRVTARAVRLRFTMGYGGGKWGVAGGKDDPTRCAVADVAPVRLLDETEPPPSHVLQVRDGESGELVGEARSAEQAARLEALRAMVFAPDGTLYTLVGSALCRSELDAEGGIRHATLNDQAFAEPMSLAVRGDRIAVGDAERDLVLLLDTRGKVLQTIGAGRERQRGPWDPRTIDRPTGVALDARGKVWVAERLYAPKRISRFAPDGTFEAECLGPAEYGGGGFLDPDLANFYYRSMHFALDWREGSWRLKNLNDRLYSEHTPTLDPHSFAYTKVGRPIVHRGRRYIVGDPGNQGSPGVVVCILDDGSPTWRPCAVMAEAHECPFLLRKEHWRDHWMARDLTGKSFIWCDHNGDGGYQVEEVELFDHEPFGKSPFRGVYWCNWLGPDLTYWGPRARLAPARFTDRGVPIYRSRDLQPFDYAELAPTYTASMRCGMRAKPGPGAASIVLSDGSLIIEGQPYVVRPDGSILGGDPEAEKTDYLPPIQGVVLDNPLHYVGTALTDSPVGEVAVVLGNSGRWFVESARDRVVVGWFFTGEDGGWGTGLPNVRGTDVTHRRLGRECFFGHFIKARDGRTYAVAGHGFHALSRIDGLDDLRVEESSLTVSPQSVEQNRKLRPVLAARQRAIAQAAKRKKSHAFRRIERRTRGFRLDGDLGDWGGTDTMVPIDEKAGLYFDGAWDERGLTLAYAGTSALGNASEDPRFLFKTGFALDFRYRSDRRTRSRQPVAGDRRLVFGPHKGEWTAVLYDYVDPAVPREQWQEFASPWVATRVARVVCLGDEEARVRFLAQDAPPRGAPEGRSAWSAEVFVRWSALGLQPSTRLKLRADAGILLPDSGGVRVARRAYWSQPEGLTVSDLGVEATLNPAAWPTLKLSK